MIHSHINVIASRLITSLLYRHVTPVVTEAMFGLYNRFAIDLLTLMKLRVSSYREAMNEHALLNKN